MVPDAYKEAAQVLVEHVRSAQMVLGRLLSWSGAVTVVAAQTISIASINGPGFGSPHTGQTVAVRGLVTAKGPSGFWLADVSNVTTTQSSGIYVFTTSATIRGQVKVGDVVSLGSARVALYRATADTDNIYLKELTSPTNITVLSSGNPVVPIIIGTDRPGPPTQQYTFLDGGNIFSVPNNQSQISTANLSIQPAEYGLDYWQSLVGMLVTIRSPVALGFPVNSFGDFWTHGDWKVSGKNKRDDSGKVDANPEAIAIGSALDGTPSPATAANSTGLRLGSTLTDITGILTYAFDTYRVLPLTAPKVLTAPDYNPEPTSLVGNSTADVDNCSLLTVGDYNVENLDPKDAHLPVIAAHIAQYLKAPDVMWLQEIQDENGATDDRNTSAKGTLDALVAAIRNASTVNDGTAVSYAWAQVDPTDGTSGGEPGGNIRPAFLYRPEILELVNFKQAGANDSAVVSGTGPNTTLNFNPAPVSPANPAFIASRKPLVAHFRIRATNATLWAIDVHQSSKGGSSPLHGDWRTPVNGAINARIAQAKVTSAFIKTILDADPTAHVMIAGDFNEFLATPAAFEPYTSIGLRDLDIVTGHDPVERYTYTFDMNNQQLDHGLVSPAIWNKTGGMEWEHIHVNTWRETTALRASDHDPSVGRLKLCGAKPQVCDLKIGKWCAAPLPSFSNRATCL
ncbi:hypothetical protein FRC06_003034 [Ceratobasidium sp. 370]|nr:hypothetical protein FRC06_003034 [Ceratobasidium sp. 370]